MPTATLTEFNRYPSKVARMADVEDVTIERFGEPVYRLTRIPPGPRTLDALIAEGRATRPAERLAHRERRVTIVDPQADVYAELLASRARR